MIRRFQEAWRAKDVDSLIALLDPSVIATADGGGHVLAFLEPIEGRDQVVHTWLRLADRVRGLTFEERSVNAQPGLVARQDGRTVAIYASPSPTT